MKSTGEPGELPGPYPPTGDVLTLDHQYRQEWESLMRENADTPEFASRPDLYAFLSREFLGDGELPIDFLEFGVYKGASMREWCLLNRSACSRFYGFDSFQGLPEYWKPGRPKGAFDLGGSVPVTSDPRVQWVVGWFQQTLPEFLTSYRPAGQLIVHNDSDLYTSTLFYLTSMNSILRRGTIVIFDELDDVLHEFRALTEYCRSYGRTYRILAHTKWFTQTSIMML